MTELSREQVEEFRLRINRDIGAAAAEFNTCEAHEVQTRENESALDVLCDMALRSLSVPAEGWIPMSERMPEPEHEWYGRKSSAPVDILGTATYFFPSNPWEANYVITHWRPRAAPKP